MKIRSVLALASALVLPAVAAQASLIYQWNYGGTSSSENTAGGNISNIVATYTPSSEVFSWDVTFSDGVTKDTDGYWLVVGPGPNPNGSAGQYAIVYFDATNLAAPTVSIFRYNGQNNGQSFSSPGDLLLTNRNNASSGITASGSQSGTQRRFQLSFDATGVNSRYGPSSSPAFPDWIGIEFGDQIGVWFHAVGGLQTGYNSNNKLNRWDKQREGWFDAENLTTTRIPAPGVASVLALGGLIAARRRRA